MEKDLTIHFHEKNLSISGLKKRLDFVKSLPIEVESENDLLDAHFGIFGANIFPIGESPAKYIIKGNIQGCKIEDTSIYLTVRRETTQDKERYFFYKNPK
ncbi:MAG: hypothetical protein PF542_01580 [Nanoarchaeota archaeon]|jgi:hypothetical protein|nr:hypothetical protein [Nanoarchaeota archaeon]